MDMEITNIQYYIPHKSYSSESEAIFTVSKNFISMNKIAYNAFFKAKEMNYVKIGYSQKNNLLILIPVRNSSEHGLKIITNKNSKKYYINFKNVYKTLRLNIKEKNNFFCSWENEYNGIFINLNNPLGEK